MIQWLSVKDIARRLNLSADTISCFVQKAILPQPRKMHIGYAELHWNIDELEMTLFKNAKNSINK